jgi:HTH-type transcriptional regulator / antitoxin HigA
MAKKMIRPLHSEADYDVALEQIERYLEREPKPGKPDADRFDGATYFRCDTGYGLRAAR